MKYFNTSLLETLSPPWRRVTTICGDCGCDISSGFGMRSRAPPLQFAVENYLVVRQRTKGQADHSMRNCPLPATNVPVANAITLVQLIKDLGIEVGDQTVTISIDSMAAGKTGFPLDSKQVLQVTHGSLWIVHHT